MKRIALLLPYFRRNVPTLIVGIGSILLAAILGLAAPLVLGSAVDALRERITLRLLLSYAGLLIGFAAVQGYFTYLQRIRLVTLSRDIEEDLRNRYYRQLQLQAQGFFHDHAVGDLMARATNDLNAIRMLCGPVIMYGSNTIFTGAGALFFMLRIDVPLTLLALAPMPLLAFSTRLIGRRIHHYFGDVQERFGAVSSQVQEHLAGLRVVRAYAREEHEERLFERRNRQYVDANRKLIRWNAAFHPAIQGLVGLGYGAVLWYGGLLAARGTISVGEFVTFTFFLARMAWPMMAIGFVINLFERGTASLKRVERVLHAEPEIADEPPLVVPGEIRGGLAARGLTFSYAEDSDAENGGFQLRDIAFEVEAGSLVALVGRTGSGKSTLLSLIPRLLDPPPDRLFVDGHDVRRLPLARLRAAVAVVPQETFLFSDTVRANIAFGAAPGTRIAGDAGDRAVRRAAELAGLGPDLEGFPDGLDTIIGERGITLSGGQKQRVALARALLRQPPILLLDDCLSAVDTATEEKILGHLREVFAGRTVFLVSHRISTVQGADQILVLERGRIVDRGTHDQLIARGGLYADLHRRQQLEEELEIA